MNFLRSEVDYSGTVISFEPAKSSFERMQEQMAPDKNWRGFNYALGRENSVADLHLGTRKGLNSIRSANEYGKRYFQSGMHDLGVETIEVRKLEDVFDDVTRDIPHERTFLKIDTQGFDMEVIAGSTAILDRVVGIQTEMSVQPIYHDMPTITEALEHLMDLGYLIAGFFPVTSDMLTIVEFDCVLVRKQDVA